MKAKSCKVSHLSIRLTKEQRRMLDEQARRRGVRPSALARETLSEVLFKNVEKGDVKK